MDGIVRCEINEEWAHAGVVEAGGFVFVGYCTGPLDAEIREHIDGAFAHLEARLATVGLTLGHVVQMDALFRDLRDIPVMEDVIRARFGGEYPVRKSIQTDFSPDDGVRRRFQVDAIAYRGCHTTF